MAFSAIPIKPPVYAPPFDFDCNGVEERDPSQLFLMSGTVMCNLDDCFNPFPPKGFASDAPCGSKDKYFVCGMPMAFNCIALLGQAPEPLRCR